jgi:hypothetical protein
MKLGAGGAQATCVSVRVLRTVKMYLYGRAYNEEGGEEKRPSTVKIHDVLSLCEDTRCALTVRSTVKIRHMLSLYALP